MVSSIDRHGPRRFAPAEYGDLWMTPLALHIPTRGYSPLFVVFRARREKSRRMVPVIHPDRGKIGGAYRAKPQPVATSIPHRTANRRMP